MPHTDSLAWLDDALAQLEADGLRRQLRVRGSLHDAVIECDGQSLVNFGGNDYLGLASDPRLADAAREAIEAEGFGSGASPLIVGRGSTHAALEAELAEFAQTEATLLFASGFAANAGTIPAVTEAEDAIFADAKNHASLIDGCRLSRAPVHIYRHNDIAHLRELLQQQGDARRRLIVSDSLFSMDGDIAPLTELAEMADQFDAMLMIDEAHAVGIFGAAGRGLCELHGMEQRVDIKVGTLSKALGTAGGFVAGRQSLVDWLCNRARSYVFSTAQPAATAAAGRAALRIMQQEPQRRQALLAAAEELSEELRAQGWQVGTSQTQVIPLLIGDAGQAMALSRALWDAGLFVPGIRPPSVPAGESLLRISLSYSHSPDMLDKLVTTLARLK